jgi:hypothetical protein
LGIGVDPVSLTGNPSSLSKFSADLRRLPTVVAQKVATAAAPVLTDLALETFHAGENAYGSTWKIRDDGTRATLKKSGTLSRYVKYIAIGTKLRLQLGVAYAKYVVGKRPITPQQGAPLPVAYSEALARVAVAICRAEMGLS